MTSELEQFMAEAKERDAEARTCGPRSDANAASQADVRALLEMLEHARRCLRSGGWHVPLAELDTIARTGREKQSSTSTNK